MFLVRQGLQRRGNPSAVLDEDSQVHLDTPPRRKRRLGVEPIPTGSARTGGKL